MTIKKQYKLQYITSDDEVFDDLKEAEAHEKELEQTNKRYHVVLTIEQDYYVDALNEQEAANKVIDGWETGSLQYTDESFCNIDTYEE